MVFPTMDYCKISIIIKVLQVIKLCRGDVHMSLEEYKKRIIVLVETSKDTDYLVALYSFAESYPDKSRENASCVE